MRLPAFGTSRISSLVAVLRLMWTNAFVYSWFACSCVSPWDSRNACRSLMLTKGRFATSAFAIAGVMFGYPANSASDAALTSATPSDFPTCACIVTALKATARAAAANFDLKLIPILLKQVTTRSNRGMPVCVCETDQAQLRHDRRRQCRRRLGVQRLP